MYENQNNNLFSKKQKILKKVLYKLLGFVKNCFIDIN